MTVSNNIRCYTFLAKVYSTEKYHQVIWEKLCSSKPIMMLGFLSFFWLKYRKEKDAVKVKTNLKQKQYGSLSKKQPIPVPVLIHWSLSIKGKFPFWNKILYSSSKFVSKTKLWSFTGWNCIKSRTLHILQNISLYMYVYTKNSHRPT